jgi:hypothetical protein
VLRGTTPRVRAVVRIERIKRNAAPGRPLWKRCRALRERLFAEMSEAEANIAMILVDADRARRKGW